jgi:hypothetical protein
LKALREKRLFFCPRGQKFAMVIFLNLPLCGAQL